MADAIPNDTQDGGISGMLARILGPTAGAETPEQTQARMGDAARLAGGVGAGTFGGVTGSSNAGLADAATTKDPNFARQSMV